MRGLCRTLIGLKAGRRHPGFSRLSKEERRTYPFVRSVAWHAGQARPLDNNILALPWGWMVPTE